MVTPLNGDDVEVLTAEEVKMETWIEKMQQLGISQIVFFNLFYRTDDKMCSGMFYAFNSTGVNNCESFYEFNHSWSWMHTPLTCLWKLFKNKMKENPFFVLEIETSSESSFVQQIECAISKRQNLLFCLQSTKAFLTVELLFNKHVADIVMDYVGCEHIDRMQYLVQSKLISISKKRKTMAQFELINKKFGVSVPMSDLKNDQIA